MEYSDLLKKQINSKKNKIKILQKKLKEFEINFKQDLFDLEEKYESELISLHKQYDLDTVESEQDYNNESKALNELIDELNKINPKDKY